MVPYIFRNQALSKLVVLSVCAHSPQQAITAISALGEMIALWTKFGEKIALHVASESVIKQE